LPSFSRRCAYVDAPRARARGPPPPPAHAPRAPPRPQSIALLAATGSNSFAAGGEWQRQVASFARYAKAFLELAFGSALDKVKPTLDTVVMVAILLVLVGTWCSAAAAPKARKAAPDAAAAKPKSG
jgi:hypothetical protein